MHAHGQIGLALEYWTAAQEQPSPSDESAMDVDNAAETTDSELDLYSLRIEAQGSPAAMYPPLRTSDAWLPETFELPTAESGDGIPWQDPPPTYVKDSAGDQGNGMAIDGERLPDLRFVAKLDPPIIMPYQTAINIFSAVNAQAPQMYLMHQYHCMLFHIPAQAVQPGTSVEADRSVLSLRDGAEDEVTHRYVLDIAKPEWGFKLEEIPFSHPRQLVELLPTLRQWAHVGALLTDAFGREPTATESTATNGEVESEMSLDDLLKPRGQESSPEGAKLRVDVGITTSPQPTLDLTFAEHGADVVSKVLAQISPNADVVVLNYEGMGEEADAMATEISQTDKAKELAKALGVSGDLGIWIEWIRGRFLRSARSS